MEPQVHSVFEPVTGTWQYLVADGIQHQAAIIDSVLDYDKETGTLKTNSADSLLKLAEEKGYTITHILETHVHADHLTASRYLQNVLGQRWAEYRPLVGIGERVSHVQATLGPIYGIPEPQMKGAFDRTFADDEKFQIGDLTAKVIHLPGHTPDHIGYVVGSNIFTGDSLFNPDVGSARCDFPGGDANALYASAAKLFSHPDHYRLYTGHDYPPPTRELTSDNKKPQPVPFTTVGQQKIENKHLKDGTEKAEFVKWRTERDSTLSTPRLMSAAMNVNLRGGKVPLSLGGASEVTFDERSMPEHLARI